MDRKKLTIAIPASIISDTPHLREKTSKIGSIARSAAIFRVNEIIIYSNDPVPPDTGIIEVISDPAGAEIDDGPASSKKQHTSDAYERKGKKEHKNIRKGRYFVFIFKGNDLKRCKKNKNSRQEKR